MSLHRKASLVYIPSHTSTSPLSTSTHRSTSHGTSRLQAIAVNIRTALDFNSWRHKPPYYISRLQSSSALGTSPLDSTTKPNPSLLDCVSFQCCAFHVFSTSKFHSCHNKSRLQSSSWHYSPNQNSTSNHNKSSLSNAALDSKTLLLKSCQPLASPHSYS